MHPTVTTSAEVASTAAAIRESGRFAIDLEFMSDGRYVPEIALVQVAWGDPSRPEIALVDPLAAEVRPVVELVAAPEVATVLHAGQADLALLSFLYGIEARGLIDTQIAAAFLGFGDQIGYTSLIGSTLDVSLDKGAQFTDWLRRPLSDKQLRYAADDVRYLLPAWDTLAARLERRGRISWVEEESGRFADKVSRRTDPREMYLKIRGANRLRGGRLGALRALAAWREEEALATNTPPSWLINERPLLELARNRPRDAKGLSGVRGVSGKTVRRHGEAMLEAIRRGVEDPPPPELRDKALPPEGQTLATLVAGLVQAHCRETGIASRFVASRDEAEKLVRWWREGNRGEEPKLGLLQGWRRELVGGECLSWLAGEVAITADDKASSGIRLVPSAIAGPPV